MARDRVGIGGGGAVGDGFGVEAVIPGGLMGCATAD